MIGDILVKIAKGDLLTQGEARELLEWGNAVQSAPELFGQLFKGLSSVATLSEITRDLGTVNRGAFISGNAGDFLDTTGNNPFTGVAMMSPGLSVGSDEASIFGMNAGTLQFWLSNLTGKIVAGEGRTALSTSGVELDLGTDETDTQVAVKWFDGTDTQRSYVIGYAVTAKNAVQIEAQPYTGKDSEIFIKSNAPSGKEASAVLVAYEGGDAWAEMVVESPGATTVAKARTTVYDANQVRRSELLLSDDSTGYSSVRLSVYDSSGTGAVEAKLREDTARLEIGNDHYIPVRGASNPNVYFNEANQDMDFIVEGTTDADLIFADAGNNRVGIGKSPSYKLDVDGDVNLTSGSIYRINGAQLDAEDIPITDSGGYYTDTDVEGALQEVATRAVDQFFTTGGNASVPASSTRYLAPVFDSGLSSSIFQIATSKACIIEKIIANTGGTQPATGSLVLTVLKNGTPTSMAITIAAGSGSGSNTDSSSSNPVTLADGDSFGWELVNNATSASRTIRACTMLVRYL